MKQHSLTISLVLLIAVTTGQGFADPVSFVRGDFNSDGVVSISDAHTILSYLFRGFWPSDCIVAADVNDDGKVQVNDAIALLNYISGSDVTAPLAPFPAPGQDPTPDDSACGEYGVGSPALDSAARLEVTDAVAGGADDGFVTLTLRLSNSLTVAGYSGTIVVDSSVVGAVTEIPKDLTGTLHGGFLRAELGNGRLSFGYLSSLVDWDIPWIQPGSDVDAVTIKVCLKEGTRAGQYPLTLSTGELVEAATGRAVFPTLVSGTLTVLEDVAPGKGCNTAGCQGPRPPPADPLPPLNAAYRLTDAVARPGNVFTVPFTIEADADVQGYSFSCDFDEEVLEALEIEPVFGAHEGFQRLVSNNQNENPGSGGVDEGFLVGAVIFSFTSNCYNMPANRSNEALRFKFQVRPDTQVTATEVKFMDGAFVTGPPVPNALTAFSTLVTPELASSFVFVNGLIGIQPDITTFVRGDSNGDAKLDISDAQHTLGYLFLGAAAPACFDAADANDDGRIDVSDAIAILDLLFLGRTALPLPYPAAGGDPTPDSMGCLTRN